MRSEKQLDIGLWEQISQPVLFFQRTDWEIFPHDGGYSLDSSFSMKADTGIGDWGLGIATPFPYSHLGRKDKQAVTIILSEQWPHFCR